MRQVMTTLGLAAALALPAVAADAATLAVDRAAREATVGVGGVFNGGEGIMFDVAVGANALTLSSIGASVRAPDDADPQFDLLVFYRAGGIAGQSDNPAAWTSLGSFAGLTADEPNLVELAFADLALAANTTYGFFITDDFRFTSVYWEPAAADDFTTPSAANADLAILPGYGTFTTDAGEYFNAYLDAGAREFLGSFTYAVAAAVPEPASWAMMIGGFGLVGGALRRRSDRPGRACA